MSIYVSYNYMYFKFSESESTYLQTPEYWRSPCTEYTDNLTFLALDFKALLEGLTNPALIMGEPHLDSLLTYYNNLS